MKHTPGPWVYDGDRRIEGREIYAGMVRLNLIAFINQGRLQNYKEDAHLISKCPDMYEALRAIVARIEGDFDNPALVKFGPLTNINNDVREIARRILAAISSNGNKGA